MADERPDLELPQGPPPTDRVPGPSGPAATLPVATIILLTCVILALVLFGGWVAFGFGVALMIFGVLLLSRYVERIAWSRRSPERLRGGLSGMNEDMTITDEVHEELSSADFPHDSPTYHELHRAEHAPGGTPARARSGSRPPGR